MTSDRYGTPAATAGAVLALVALVLFAGITMIAGASFVIGTDEPSASPVLATWVPLGAALGVLAGLVGVIAGRPVRAPALLAGYALTLAGLIGGWALA